MDKKGLIGVQMMMLKDKVAEVGVYEVFKTLNAMGYHCVEISQIPMTQENVSQMKQGAKDFNIKIAAMSAAVEPMMPGLPGEYLSSDFEKIVQDCKTLGCNYLRIGMLPMTRMGDYEKSVDFAKLADHYAEKLAEHDIKLYYHNHHLEFTKYKGETLLDIIRNNTKHIGFELDVHWIQRGGMNPVDVIKRFAGRVSLIHLKDYRIGEIDLDFSKEFNPGEFKTAFTSVVQFAEVGEGTLDMPAIIEAGLQSGGQYFFIEQDDQYGKDPYECLEISRDNLYAMGYKAWFE